MPLDGHAGPAPRVSDERASALLSAALLAFDELHAPNASHGKSSANAGKSLWAAPKTWAVAAGSLLALAGGAAAAHHYLQSAPAPVIAPVAPKQTPPAPDPEPQAAESAAESATPAANPRERETERPARAAVRVAPEDLLQKANHQRALGQFRDAAQIYAQVYERFPRSSSAYVARVAAGAIELEHLSNPTRARKLFEQALREQPRGALDLEARQGLSVALRDLEDRAGEREALRALIAQHPDSPAARRAQVRLREIGGE
jgi:tetratricopeptide (TPR) repeat protein